MIPFCFSKTCSMLLFCIFSHFVSSISALGPPRINSASHCLINLQVFPFFWPLIVKKTNRRRMKILQMLWETRHTKNIHVTKWMMRISTTANAWSGRPTLEHTWTHTNKHTMGHVQKYECTHSVDKHARTHKVYIHFDTYHRSPFLHVLKPSRA